MIRVVVDRDLCGAHGVCEREAPEVFQVVETDDGLASVAVLIELPPEPLHARVWSAARQCPNQAITIIEE
jgi:ferredoxin